MQGFGHVINDLTFGWTTLPFLNNYLRPCLNNFSPYKQLRNTCTCMNTVLYVICKKKLMAWRFDPLQRDYDIEQQPLTLKHRSLCVQGVCRHLFIEHVIVYCHVQHVQCTLDATTCQSSFQVISKLWGRSGHELWKFGLSMSEIVSRHVLPSVYLCLNSLLCNRSIRKSFIIFVCEFDL